MSEFEIRPYRDDDESALIRLWQQCDLIRPWNNPRADIVRKCADSRALFFIGCKDAQVIASCMAGYDGHRGWLYYLAVAAAWQRQGIATKMVRHAEAHLLELGCPKIDLMVRKGNASVIAFYQSIGYSDDPVAVLSRRLLEDEKHDFA